jgi:hypothetical protein
MKTKKKMGRPRSTSEKKVVVSGYVPISHFKEIAKAAHNHGRSISAELDNLIASGLKHLPGIHVTPAEEEKS